MDSLLLLQGVENDVFESALWQVCSKLECVGLACTSCPLQSLDNLNKSVELIKEQDNA